MWKLLPMVRIEANSWQCYRSSTFILRPQRSVWKRVCEDVSTHYYTAFCWCKVAPAGLKTAWTEERKHITFSWRERWVGKRCDQFCCDRTEDDPLCLFQRVSLCFPWWSWLAEKWGNVEIGLQNLSISCLVTLMWWRNSFPLARINHETLRLLF